MTRKPARWADLRLRILSAAVLAPLALGCIWIGGAAFAGLIALVAVGLSYEWLGLCGRRSSLIAPLLFVAVPLSVVLTALGNPAVAVALLGVATLVGAAISRGLSPARPLAFGIPYLGIGAVCTGLVAPTTGQWLHQCDRAAIGDLGRVTSAPTRRAGQSAVPGWRRLSRPARPGPARWAGCWPRPA